MSISVLEMHNLLHRAGVEVIHRSDEMIKEMVEIESQGLDSRELELAITRTCDYFHIPYVPTVKILGAVLNPDAKLLAEIRSGERSCSTRSGCGLEAQKAGEKVG